MGSNTVINEKIIHARPAVVWNALVDEFRGAARFWTPDNTFAANSSDPSTVGAHTAVTVHTRGAHRKGLKLRFTAQTTVATPCEYLETEYIDGALRGTASYMLVPRSDGQRTKLVMKFDAKPRGLASVLAKVIPKAHAQATDDAFRRLDALVWTPLARQHQPERVAVS